MRNNYPIVANCNFESRDDATGKAVHCAREAIDATLTFDCDLIDAMQDLEKTLDEYGDKFDVVSQEYCEEAEQGVASVWIDRVAGEVEAEHHKLY